MPHRGIRPGDVVALTFDSEVLLALALLGLARLGATTLSIPRSATVFQRRQWAAQAACAALVSDRPERYETGVPAISMTGSGIGRQGRVRTQILQDRPQHNFSIIVGSGSTGLPKLIPITHRQMRHRCDLQITHTSYLASDRIFSLSHIEFSSATNRFFSTLNLGAGYVFAPSADFERFSFLKASRVTVLFGAVLHMEKMLRDIKDGEAKKLDFLRIIRVAGSMVSSDLRHRIRHFLNGNLHVVYGTNECGRISIASIPEVFDVSGSVGFPIEGVTAEVVDERDQPLVGLDGFIRVRTPSMIEGYLGETVATQKHFRNGWFYTSDRGRTCADGQIVLLGRADDLMIFNGINIYPAEIEQCLRESPDIQDVAVISLRHAVHQDIPVCALVIKPGHPVTTTDIVAYAREKLGFKSPKRFVFLEKIPRNAQGKLARAELEELLSAPSPEKAG